MFAWLIKYFPRLAGPRSDIYTRANTRTVQQQILKIWTCKTVTVWHERRQWDGCCGMSAVLRKNFHTAPVYPLQLLLRSCGSNLKEVCWLFGVLFYFIHWHGAGGLLGENTQSQESLPRCSLQVIAVIRDRERDAPWRHLSPALLLRSDRTGADRCGCGWNNAFPYGMA